MVAGAIFTTREAGEKCGLTEQQVRRLFDTKAIPEAIRFGNKRMVPSSLLPAIVEAAKSRGWLKSEPTTVVPTTEQLVAEVLAVATGLPVISENTTCS